MGEHFGQGSDGILVPFVRQPEQGLAAGLARQARERVELGIGLVVAGIKRATAALVALACSQACAQGTSLNLWYRQPAKRWDSW